MLSLKFSYIIVLLVMFNSVSATTFKLDYLTGCLAQVDTTSKKGAEKDATKDWNTIKTEFDWLCEAPNASVTKPAGNALGDFIKFEKGDLCIGRSKAKYIKSKLRIVSYISIPLYWIFATVAIILMFLCCRAPKRVTKPKSIVNVESNNKI